MSRCTRVGEGNKILTALHLLQTPVVGDLHFDPIINPSLRRAGVFVAEGRKNGFTRDPLPARVPSIEGDFDTPASVVGAHSSRWVLFWLQRHGTYTYSRCPTDGCPKCILDTTIVYHTREVQSCCTTLVLPVVVLSILV